MRRLSRPIHEIADRYDTVVVGSGYGGSIAAQRCAEHGESVCVLERGLELQPGDYPETFPQALRQVQVDTPVRRRGNPSGLFDYRRNPDLDVLVGCGLGGTSLINAGVLLRPDEPSPGRSRPSFFQDSRWPEEIRTDASSSRLDTFYDRARSGLGATPYPRASCPQPDSTSTVRWENLGAETGPVRLDNSNAEMATEYPPLTKARALRIAAGIEHDALMEPSGRCAHNPAIAVAFGSVQDEGGVRRSCTLCGNCVTGCNDGAKSTLIHNYLARARAAGASIFCGVRVRRVEKIAEPESADARWSVCFELVHASGGLKGVEMWVLCRDVFLAAGSLGSTEILMRSQDRGLRFSPKLGQGFHGNGDVVALAYNGDHEVRGIGRRTRSTSSLHQVGPTITSSVATGFGKDFEGVVQEGALPRPLRVLRFALPILARTSGQRASRQATGLVAGWAREIGSLLFGGGRFSMRRTMVMLVMARRRGGEDRDHERDRGRLRLQDDRIRTEFDGAGSRPLVRTVDRVLRSFAEGLGARLIRNPVWTSSRRALLTVHPLGGCVMAECRAKGVTNHLGEVFDGDGPDEKSVHPGLQVLDGSIMPMPLGVNPLWTICALTERAMDKRREDRGIEATVGAKSRSGFIAQHTRPGYAFAETMVGRLLEAEMVGTYWEAQEPDFDLNQGISQGELELSLNARSEDIERVLSDPGTPIPIIGQVRIHSSRVRDLPDGRYVLANGSFRLFVEVDRFVETRWMQYRGTLRNRAGDRFLFEGRKILYDSPRRGADAWRGSTRLFCRICKPEEGESAGRPAKWTTIAGGLIRLRRSELLRTVLSVRFPGAGGSLKQIVWAWRVGRYYGLRLLESFSLPFGPRRRLDAYAIRRRSRAARDQVDTSRDSPFHMTHYKLRTSDDAYIKLTRVRLRQGDPGYSGSPVVLAPGFGMSTYAFRIPTVERSFSEFLLREGMDVWLLDYRVSDFTESSASQFTLDDIARYDWPAALDFVFGKTSEQVALFGHCVASGSLLMSALKGWVDLDKVRSITASQTHLVWDHPPLNRLKAHLRSGKILEALGATVLNPDMTTDAPLRTKIFDWLLGLYPSREHCRNPVCRRNLFLYGEIYRHDQLNADTHDAIYDMFDRANIRTFQHLTAMIRAGGLVPQEPYLHEGRNFYLSDGNAGRLSQVPVTLVQGKLNAVFRRKGAVESLRWLGSAAERELVAKGRTPQDARRRIASHFDLQEFEGYGHLDLFIGRDAHEQIFPRVYSAISRRRDPSLSL